MEDIKDPITESMPSDWTNEQKIIAKEAMAVLTKHYPGWVWQIEWSANVGNQLGVMIIRLGDVPTGVVYTVNPRTLDRSSTHWAVHAGGEFLEALGLPRAKNRNDHDEVRGLARTPSGLIVPYADAVPSTNPGYAKIKKQSAIIHAGA